MVFSSPIFFFLFLPLTLLLYALAPRFLRNFVLLFASACFYAFGELQHLALLGVSLVINYIGGIWIAGGVGDARKRRLSVLVATNIAGLLWYKYAGFFATNWNATSDWLGLNLQTAIPNIALPLGISFFTFHAISYLVDVYRRKVEPQRDPFAYALYILLFPQLIAGPIIRYHDIAHQLHERTTRLPDFAEGCRRIIIGLAKKLLVANPMGVVADAIYATPVAELSTGAVWLAAVAYALQIYFDFSAYSDMAIGLCRLFGFRLRENFNYPYIADSIQDFWRRWHISLSTWFRDYVYIPLGGNRQGDLRTHVNLLTVFFLCGLWHGASWNFIVWGLFHGLFLVLERTSWGGVLAKLPGIARTAYTLFVVMIGWVLFRADSLEVAGDILARMFWPSDGRLGGEFIDPLGWLVMVIGILTAGPWLGRTLLSDGGPESSTARQLRAAVAVSVLAGICFVALFSTTYNPFIYFRF